MAESDPGGCCRFCFSFIFTSGLTALFMWLSLHTSSPAFSVERFYVPALNTTADSAANVSIYFELQLTNRMKDKGVDYSNISLTFLYGGKNSGSPIIANYTVQGFYQGHNKKAHRANFVQTVGVPWEEAIGAVSNGSAVKFGVQLATGVKFKITFWYTKRHRLEVAGNVEVGGGGEKVEKNGIKLKSGAPGRCWGWAPTVISFVFASLMWRGRSTVKNVPDNVNKIEKSSSLHSLNNLDGVGYSNADSKDKEAGRSAKDKFLHLLEELDLDEIYFPLLEYLSTLGLKESHFIQMYERHMPSLQINVESAEEIFEYLLSVGVKHRDIKKIILRQPQILEYTVENILKHRVAFLNSLGIPESRIGVGSTQTEYSQDGH